MQTDRLPDLDEPLKVGVDENIDDAETSAPLHCLMHYTDIKLTPRYNL